jgi:hypothetical protein
MKLSTAIVAASIAAAAAVSCSDNGTPAEQRGVGAQCVTQSDCKEGLDCLDFKGGYCGLSGCTHDSDCPEGSACILSYQPGTNYCFLVCVDKSDCNHFRAVDYESNCSSNVTFADGAKGRKACVPPSGN